MLTDECNQVCESWEMLIVCSATQLKRKKKEREKEKKKAGLKCRAGNDQAGERKRQREEARRNEQRDLFRMICPSWLWENLLHWHSVIRSRRWLQNKTSAHK